MCGGKKTFAIKTLGCKTNQIEGQIILKALSDLGYAEVQKYSEADFFILNSCSVTSHSDSQCAYLINRSKRENPNIKVVLTGCVAQTLDKHKTFELNNVDLVLGNNEKLDIKKYIDTLFQDEKKVLVEDIFKIEKFNHAKVAEPYQTRVSIKIQEGCNNRCSYCLIPYARGNSRSNSTENIISQIEFLCAAGTKEIVLTGIHIGQWGLEFNSSLLNLLKEIEKTPILRYRLGSLYINEISDDMIEFLKSSEKFCPHFHLSLQSMCDKTLKNMNRKYSTKEAVDLIHKLSAAFPYAFFGCDIIVGFPDEDDNDFETTFNNLKNLPLSQIHAFPYSKREGTPAGTMKNQIQDNVKTLRTKRIMELSEIKHNDFLQRNKNCSYEVLFERKSKKTGAYSAITKNYIKVFIKDERDDLRNTFRVVNMADFDKLY